MALQKLCKQFVSVATIHLSLILIKLIEYDKCETDEFGVESTEMALWAANVCYHSFRIFCLIISYLNNVSIQLYCNLYVVLYGCETWFLALQEGYRLKMFQGMGC